MGDELTLAPGEKLTIKAVPPVPHVQANPERIAEIRGRPPGAWVWPHTSEGMLLTDARGTPVSPRFGRRKSSTNRHRRWIVHTSEPPTFASAGVGRLMDYLRQEARSAGGYSAAVGPDVEGPSCFAHPNRTMCFGAAGHNAQNSHIAFAIRQRDWRRYPRDVRLMMLDGICDVLEWADAVEPGRLYLDPETRTGKGPVISDEDLLAAGDAMRLGGHIAHDWAVRRNNVDVKSDPGEEIMGDLRRRLLERNEP